MKSDSIVRRTRMQKIQATIARAAVQLAASRNDPLYKKYARCRNLWIEYKKQITQRYFNQAKSQVLGKRD